jgi:hypothetical protein
LGFFNEGPDLRVIFTKFLFNNDQIFIKTVFELFQAQVDLRLDFLLKTIREYQVALLSIFVPVEDDIL